ncbi:hypothetical protein CRUP_012934 [Coryphaenoides rupestris]|nr:hypothetical protein CRUP_012934 [Coryphaenoides rupestris]
MSGCRIFIGRLNPSAREKDVERFFKGYGRIRDIDLKRGFGFVEFDDPRDAEDAVYELDGKELCNESRNPPPMRTENRLIVENLSSRVSWQDLKDFMRQAGEVTFADAHRPKLNEGVVEFASYSDLKNALEKLSGKEINGRKIKLVEAAKKRSRSRSRSNSSSRSRSRSRSRGRSRTPQGSRSRSRSRTPRPYNRSHSNSPRGGGSPPTAARASSKELADKRSGQHDPNNWMSASRLKLNMDSRKTESMLGTYDPLSLKMAARQYPRMKPMRGMRQPIARREGLITRRMYFPTVMLARAMMANMVIVMTARIT